MVHPLTKTRASCTLESGDRLTRPEFHRRYSASGIARAELIEGVVYVSSPVSLEYHGEPEAILGGWAYQYWLDHPGLRIGHNSTLVLDGENEVQPDVCLFRENGAARLDGGYVIGPPELVIEIAASSVSIDMHAKKEVYRRNGVKEYLVWRVLDEAVDWFVLREGQYVALTPDEAGVIESPEFPGLRLNVRKLVAGDLRAAVSDAPAE